MLTPQALANAGVVLVTLKGKTVDESLYFKGYDTAVERDRAINEEFSPERTEGSTMEIKDSMAGISACLLPRRGREGGRRSFSP